MWPPDMLPRQRIEQAHGIALPDAWLDHVRGASVRFNVGGSGSFVSPHGLVLTNHHVAGDCIAKLATPAHDYLAAGYVAGVDGPEARCPDLEIDSLVSIQDVTGRVRDARKDGMSDVDGNRAMKGEMSAIEKECHDETQLRCDVVTLYAGAMYHLYRYRRYTDVRLVFAPEADVAFFGGDPDNFTFPRFDFDLAIFRVYAGTGAQAQPIAPAEWLRWDAAGPKDGATVFTSGHPARTSRDATVAELEVLRDVVYPRTVERLGRVREGLRRWAATGAEGARQAREAIFGVENSLKALGGYERGLKDAALLRKKSAAEAAVRAGVDRDPTLKAKLGTTWDDVARVEKAYAASYPSYAALEAGLGGQLLRVARALVRLPAERALPNDKRLPEFRETALEELSMHALSPAAMYPGVEEAYVTTWLRELSAAHAEGVKKILDGRAPEQAAREICVGSRLFDVFARRALWDGGAAAVAASTDPVIVAMRSVDPEARAERKRYDDEVEAPMRVLGRHLAEAAFAVNGTSRAPDATFTLRISAGVVKGYTEAGRAVPWSTDFAGMFHHATGTDPYKLPDRWLHAQSKLRPTTPLNFVSTNDIIGGNSGSPVVGADGQLVGLIFDGNLASLPNRFIYDDVVARAVSVDTAGILEALRVVYGANALVDELSSR
jgi:S1-C subfamily serine protease